ncbi:LysR family substrate-binding domain-containing protein [Streptomyces sp. NPDC088557]|uniref:LysR family substrate-binding domain-containing protein n=1 Tax=Streptomyces sp. NPDC088557 TaxID=3365867 RepID=UPI00381F6C27
MTGSDASPSDPASDSPSGAPSFRLAYVPGVTPSKWVRVWHERLPDVSLGLLPVTPAEAFGALRDGTADAGLVRLPVDGDDLSAIPLYTETTVVVVPKDHAFTAAEELTADDLAGELVLHPLDDTLGWERPPGLAANERPATTADAIELVAAGVGVLAVPQSVARLHHRKDLTYRTLVDVAQSRVGLAWPAADEAPDLVEEFIGIVRGRTVNSTRGRRAEALKGQKQPKERKGGGRKQADSARSGKPGGGSRTAGRPAARKGGGTGGSGKGRTSGKPRRKS